MILYLKFLAYVSNGADFEICKKQNLFKKKKTCSSFVTLCTFEIKSRKQFSASWCGFIVPF